MPTPLNHFYGLLLDTIRNTDKVYRIAKQCHSIGNSFCVETLNSFVIALTVSKKKKTYWNIEKKCSFRNAFEYYN